MFSSWLQAGILSVCQTPAGIFGCLKQYRCQRHCIAHHFRQPGSCAKPQPWSAAPKFDSKNGSLGSCLRFSCRFAPALSPMPGNPGAGYIGEFEFVDNHRSGKIVVELNGRLNKCGAISPRYDIAAKDIEAWVGRLLPSRQVSRASAARMLFPALGEACNFGTCSSPPALAQKCCSCTCSSCVCLCASNLKPSAHVHCALTCFPTESRLQFGHIILTTSQGIMDHEEAR